MSFDVNECEGRAKDALSRLRFSMDNDCPTTFPPSQCRDILRLIEALRDNQAIAATPNDLETPCLECHGMASDDACDVCNGVGYIPTRRGQKIIDLVARHIFGDFEETDVIGDSRPDVSINP